MTLVNIAQPDITLVLDIDGVIRDATLSDAIASEDVRAWLGRPWTDTATGAGSSHILEILAAVRASGLSAFRRVDQRFPSGRELPIEYTTVRLGGDGGVLAVGRNYHAVYELQSRLVAAQRAMEQESWRLRNIETRYRLLFDSSNEAVLMLDKQSLRVVEANPTAARDLNVGPGWDFVGSLQPHERQPFEAMLARVREQGRAPGTVIHYGPEREPRIVRASMLETEIQSVFLLQISRYGISGSAVDRPSDEYDMGELVERLPDAILVLDRDARILRANRMFLDLVQVGAEGLVLGESLEKWLQHPGTGAGGLQGVLRRYGGVRRLPAVLLGELGSTCNVEISAAADSETTPKFFGTVLREVGDRPLPPDMGLLRATFGELVKQNGRMSLRDLVHETVNSVEQHCITSALEIASGNRTMAAKILGLSRQSLHTKLNQFGIAGKPDSQVREDTE
jgi:transcriptional regulator PpsR